MKKVLLGTLGLVCVGWLFEQLSRLRIVIEQTTVPDSLSFSDVIRHGTPFRKKTREVYTLPSFAKKHMSYLFTTTAESLGLVAKAPPPPAPPPSTYNTLTDFSSSTLALVSRDLKHVLKEKASVDLDNPYHQFFLAVVAFWVVQ